MDDKSAAASSHENTEQPESEQSTSVTSKQVTGSSPIEIKQTQKGPKFGVLQARHSPTPSGVITGSDGEPVPIDEIIKTANTMSTMLMAHKIALEDDFRLEPGMDIAGPLMSLSPIIGSSSPKSAVGGGQQSEPNLQSKVKDIVHDAYWDVFKEELATQTNENKDERQYDVCKQLLMDIKQKIVDLLLPQHTRLKRDIEDRLDSKIIDQLSRIGSLDLLDYARYILDVLSKLCAPVRDDKIRELISTTDIVPLYRGIMELLEAMRLDFANFTLNRFKPHIKAHSQDYEREKFNEILKQQESIGIDGLEYTKVWLARAVEKVDTRQGIKDLVNESCNNSDLDHNEELSSSIMASNSDASDKSSPKISARDTIIKSDIVTKVLNVAYSELLEWSPETQKLYPETLLFDEATFKQLGEQYKTLVLASSILLTTFAFVNKYKLHDNNDFRIMAKSNVITLLTASYDQPYSPTSSTGSPNLTKPQQPDQIKLETVSTRLCEDIKHKLKETNKNFLDSFESQIDLFKRQIVDIQSPSNRIRELARRRIIEFVETLLTLDVEHERKKFSSKSAPPVSIPLGLNCLADEITLTMAQLVKIIRYNRKVFFDHYQNILIELIHKKLKE